MNTSLYFDSTIPLFSGRGFNFVKRLLKSKVFCIMNDLTHLEIYKYLDLGDPLHWLMQFFYVNISIITVEVHEMVLDFSTFDLTNFTWTRASKSRHSV